MRYLILIWLLFLSISNLRSQNSDLSNSISKGENIYSKKCATCHGKDGLGKGKRIPPLAKSDYLLNNKEASILGILFGQNGEIIVNGVSYNRKMKAIKLSDIEIAHVMNYVQNSWGNENSKVVTEKEVKKIRLKFSKNE